MEWIERLNNTMDYIENHLTDTIDYEQLGRIACCSAYHFQRMFTYMAGATLSEYIRRRKMSLAAVDLQGGDAKVIEIAAKYGYNSPTAFNRAFQAVHGIAPSAVKNEGVSVKSFPPLTFQITVKGAEELTYHIETKDAFRIIGVSAPLHQEIEKNFSIVPDMWQNAVQNGTLEKLAGLMDTPPMGILGVSACNEAEHWKFPVRKRTKRLRNILCLRPLGQSFRGKAPICPYRIWNGALCWSGCRLRVMSTPTRRILRFI